GGGGGGTLWLDLPPASTIPMTLLTAGGVGGKPGGGAGAPARLLSAITLDDGRFSVLAVAGPGSGFRCQPAGHWVTGRLFEDNGQGQTVNAFNGRRDHGEAALAGWTVSLLDAQGQPLQHTRSDGQGGFLLRLDEARSHGQPLSLQVDVPAGWRQSVATSLDGRPGQQQGASWRWPMQANPDQHSGPLMQGWVKRPGWQAPADQSLSPGSTAVLTFHYQATVSGEVQLSRQAGPVHSVLLDRQCTGDSEQWQADSSPWWPVTAGEALCVRVPITVGNRPETVSLQMQTRVPGQGLPWSPQRASVHLRPGP
ncbi:MAG: hypothetical protein R3292_14130, partial [Alcanivorax sp.]|nr:hypothetical protein [Alcanivorax sp.]